MKMKKRVHAIFDTVTQIDVRVRPRPAIQCCAASSTRWTLRTSAATVRSARRGTCARARRRPQSGAAWVPRWQKWPGGHCISSVPNFTHSLGNGHTMLKTPVLVRSLKLRNIGPGQYLDGRPPRNIGCSCHFCILVFCPDCFSFLPFRSLLCSLNAAEWLSRMDHLTGATNLGEAGNFGIDVALARTHNVSKRFSTCAEKYDGCARLPDSYRDLRPLVLTTSETDLLGVQQDLLVEYVRQKSFSQVPRIAI